MQGWGIVVDLTMYGLAKAADKTPGGFAAWQGIAVFLGGAFFPQLPLTALMSIGQTLIASAVAWFMLGTPNEVRWLSKREKVMANSRIMINHAGTDMTGKKTWKWDHVKEAFMDPVLWFQFINAFLSSVVCFMNTGRI